MTEIDVRVFDRLARSISELAKAINHLAGAPMETKKGTLTFGQASYDTTDPQTAELRLIQKGSGDEG